MFSVALEAAYKRLGVTSKAELDRIAADNKRAWEVIKADGTASLTTKQAAFRRYAESAIAANGGVADSTLRAEASSLKLSIQVDKTGKTIVTAMDKSAEATEKTKKVFNELGQEVNAAGEAVNQLAGRIDGARTKTQDLLGSAARAARNEGINSSNSINARFTPGSGFLPTTREVGVGQAVNKPRNGEWTYSLVGFSIPGVDANGRQLAGGWVPVRGPSGLSVTPFAAGSGGLSVNPFGASDPRQAPSGLPSAASAGGSASASGTSSGVSLAGQYAQEAAALQNLIRLRGLALEQQAAAANAGSPVLGRYEIRINGATTYTDTREQAEALLRELERGFGTQIGG